jgi:DNA-binding response OmpR family regulator
MPRLDGLDLASKLRANHKRMMVLLISGTAPDAEIPDYVEFLPKPYNQAALATKVRDLLRRAGTLR